MSVTSPSTPQGDDRGSLVAELAHLNEQIRTQSFALVGPVSFPSDLTMRQVHVLLAAQADGVSVHELADALTISAPAASGLVDRLAAKGLVTRVEDNADRRVRHVMITDAGRTMLSQMNSAFDRLHDELVDLLDVDELRVFRDNSQLMLNMIERLRDSRG